MGNVFYFKWEIRVIELFQSFESSFTTFISKLFTLLGDEYLMILLLGIIYWGINKELGKKISLCVCFTLNAGTLIKGFLLRRRPYMDNDSIKCIRPAHDDGDIMNPNIQGYSCPSLHSSLSVSLFGVLFNNVKNNILKVICVLLPILIGLSRIFFGVHYPTDVLFGWTLGLISVFIFSFIYKKYGYKVGFIIILLLSLIGFFYCNDTEFYSGYGVSIGLFFGFLYEEKYVKFKNTKKWWCILLRSLFGVILFIIVSSLLKLPIKNISSDNYFSLIYRTLRYALSTFIIIGIYPYLFKKFKF